VRGTFRIPAHQPALLPRTPEATDPTDDDPERFYNRPCYEFNPQLRTNLDDRHCSHCRHYLTARCPHIDEFLDDVDDLSPE
jgi:hypothetical protein